MDVRFCKEQEPPPRGTRCELKVLRVLVLRAPHRRALGELFFLLTDDLHGRWPLGEWPRRNWPATAIPGDKSHVTSAASFLQRRISVPKGLDAVEKVIGVGSLQTRRKNDAIRSPIHDRR